MKNNNYNFELLYADSFRKILKEGVLSHNRTGIDSKAIQHQYFYIEDVRYHFPILRGKKVYPKMALKELIWMLLGRTDVKWLNDHKVTYWDEWTLYDGTIGKSYGYQYRNFSGIDQVSDLVNEMLNNPESRRHIINLWNSSDLKDMALPPCMYDYHFICIPIKENEYRIDLHAKMRSNDSFLGAPYNFLFTGWFLNLIAIYLNLKSEKYKYIVGNIHFTADDYHMYVNHEDAVIKYLANIEEDKNKVVTNNISECYINHDIFVNKEINNIDDFINIIEENISTNNIKIIDNNTLNTDNFEYSPITAQIAV